MRVLMLRTITRGRVGRGTSLGRDVEIAPGSRIDIGDNCRVGDRCVLEVSRYGISGLSIGSDTWISHNCHVTCRGSITIGAHVMIGEFTSLRDTSHGHEDTERPMKSQEDIVGSIIIEDDVWIGRGALILGRPEGLIVGQGAVVGANSVVNRSVAPFDVVGGVPARTLKHRIAPQPQSERESI
jgi:acetyltransferase-like isoleucine patch superfamily enzyme